MVGGVGSKEEKEFAITKIKTLLDRSKNVKGGRDLANLYWQSCIGWDRNFTEGKGAQYNARIGEMARKVSERRKTQRQGSCRTVLCFVHGEGVSVPVIVCYDRRANDLDKRRYGRSKFATQQIDFCARDKTDRNNYKMTSHGILLCTRGRDERGCCRVIK